MLCCRAVLIVRKTTIAFTNRRPTRPGELGPPIPACFKIREKCNPASRASAKYARPSRVQTQVRMECRTPEMSLSLKAMRFDTMLTWHHTGMDLAVKHLFANVNQVVLKLADRSLSRPACSSMQTAVQTCRSGPTSLKYSGRPSGRISHEYLCDGILTAASSPQSTQPSSTLGFPK